MAKCSPDVHSGQLIAKLIKSRNDNLPQTLLVNVINRVIILNPNNKSAELIHLYCYSGVVHCPQVHWGNLTSHLSWAWLVGSGWE